MRQHITYTANQRWLAKFIACSFCATAVIPAQAALNIPDTPLQTSVSAEPNVMMILDDSGSMQWEVMPDNITYNEYLYPRPNNVYGGSTYNNVAVDTNANNRYSRLMRSAGNNKVYYDPTVTYIPWSRADGSLWPNAVPTAAYNNPADTSRGTRNLTTNLTESSTWRNDNGGTSSGNRTYFPATYFNYNGGNIWNSGSYTKVEIRANNAPFPKAATRTDCAGNTCTYSEEIQNFANWYTYYRSRVLTARAGIGRAFSAQNDGLRVGFGTLNHGSTNIDGVNTGSIISGVRLFKDTDRSNFFTSLYTTTIPTSGTPLKTALDRAGRYFSRTDDRGPWSTSPGSSGGSDLACRLSYTILMTDGYYGDSISGIGNSDNTAGSTITGTTGQSYTYNPTSPFSDGNSNTLADVAMHYWKRDLRTDLDNAVPVSTRNPAFWQHMSTFAVGLGVSGSVDPTQAYAAIGDSSVTINWPNPTSNDAKLDDLLHAAINGRGEFFSAQNPTEFADSLSAMLREIIERKSSSSSASINGTRLTSGSKVFVPSFNTSGWVGELEAYTLTSSGLSSTPLWKASQNIPAHGSRKIFTTSGNNAVEFKWSNLDSDDRNALGSENILNFIRGDRSKETSNGGSLRTRTNVLGDIVHSSPVYQKDQQTVYIGANDGMLHAFNSETGAERFAYIPSAVIGNLSLLSETAYQHKYFVDGEMSLIGKSDSGLNNTYLVSTLGIGGKGLFALDVTTPASFGTGNVAWEYNDASDNELGLMMGRPVFARLNNGTPALIVGNGYNSSSGKAALYIINLSTGSLIRKFVLSNDTNNGLATPGIVDDDGDGDIDYVFAGDLLGNVWKFDLNSTSSTAWPTPTRFFTAKDGNGNAQPITTQITTAVNYLQSDPNVGKRFIFFGTGSYFRSGDINDKSLQSWYGLIDGNSISSRSLLKERAIHSVMTADGQPARSFEAATDGDMAGTRGWYLDWLTPPGNREVGERVVTPSVMYRLTEPTLLASSITPDAADPCQPGGTGYINAINAFTGGSLAESFFVVTNVTGSGVVGSLDIGVGMPSQPSLVIDDNGAGQLIVGGTGDTSTSGTNSKNVDNTEFNPGNYGGRIYWREVLR